MASRAAEPRAVEHVGAVAEPFGDLGRTDRPCSSGGDLDRERKPSSRPHRSTTASRSVCSMPTPASCTRSRNSSTAGHASGSGVPTAGTANGASATTDSPGSSSGDRLVASTVGRSRDLEDAPNREGCGLQEISQLSTRSSTFRSPGTSSNAWNESKPSSAASTPGTASASSTRVRSTVREPSSKRFSRALAASLASAVLPTPPGPITVTRRPACRRRSTSSSS